MKHLYAILIKFIMIAVVLEIILQLATDLNATEILYIAVAVTVVTYLVGDLLVLPASHNSIATISDIALALLTIYLFDFLLNIRAISFTDALMSGVVIGIWEMFFHVYVEKNIFGEHAEG